MPETQQVLNKCSKMLGLQRMESRLPEVGQQVKRLPNRLEQNDIYTRSRDKDIMKRKSGFITE